jgi:hypothetical protein
MIRFKCFLVAFFLAIFSFCIYTLTDNSFPTTDSIPNNITAVNIIHHNRIDLTNYKDDLIKRGLINISIENKSTKKIFSKTPILNGILSAPFFYVNDKLSNIRSPSSDFVINTDYYQIVGKKYASFLSSISVFIIFFCLNILFKNTRISFIGALTYTFGGFVFGTSSQANWEHAPSLLLISLGYLFLIKFFKKNQNVYLIPVSLFFLLAYFIRPVNIVFIISLVLLLVFYKKYKGLAILIILNTSGYFIYQTFCRIIGIPNGYSNEIIDSIKNIHIFNSFKIFISILISPNSGLFPYYPIYVFSFMGLIFFIKKIKCIYLKDAISKIVLFSVFNIVFIFGLNSIWWAWTGGTSWGPRLLTEASVSFIILITYWLTEIKTNTMLNSILFIFLFLISIFNSLVGIYCNTTEWNDKYWNGKSMFEGAWIYKPTMINYYIFNKRSFFTKKLNIKDGQITLTTKTILFHVPERKFKLIYNRTDNLMPVNLN